MATTLTAGPVRPADDLDELLGDLLDLQHDLAEVVVWLAETWPTDLPDLRPYGSGRDTAQLELWAYCSDLDQLAALRARDPIETGPALPTGRGPGDAAADRAAQHDPGTDR